jgi:hypothetical protein
MRLLSSCAFVVCSWVKFTFTYVYWGVAGEGGMEWIRVARDMKEWRAFVNAIMGLQIPRKVDILGSWATVLYRVNVLLVSGVDVGLSLCKGSALKAAERMSRTVLEWCAKEEGLKLQCD